MADEGEVRIDVHYKSLKFFCTCCRERGHPEKLCVLKRKEESEQLQMELDKIKKILARALNADGFTKVLERRSPRKELSRTIGRSVLDQTRHLTHTSVPTDSNPKRPFSKQYVGLPSRGRHSGLGKNLEDTQRLDSLDPGAWIPPSKTLGTEFTPHHRKNP